MILLIKLFLTGVLLQPALAFSDNNALSDNLPVEPASYSLDVDAENSKGCLREFELNTQILKNKVYLSLGSAVFADFYFTNVNLEEFKSNYISASGFSIPSWEINTISKNDGSLTFKSAVRTRGLGPSKVIRAFTLVVSGSNAYYADSVLTTSPETQMSCHYIQN